MLLKPSDTTCLVTHRSCLDGTGAALMFLWAGGRRENILFRNPSGLLLSHRELPENVEEVWYADCCPSDLTNPADGLPFRVFDHHVSNARKHSSDPRCLFDMNRSGTSIMADVLGLDRATGTMRVLVEALEDYDLGRFDNEAGVRLADIASTYSQEDLLHLLASKHPMDILRDEVLSSRAAGASAVRQLYCVQAAESRRVSPMKFPHLEDEVVLGIAALPRDWKNEAAQLILKDPMIEVAVILDVMGQMVSLRSRAGGPDCSLIAGLYGGGGHARAAGFKIDGKELLFLFKNEVF